MKPACVAASLQSAANFVIVNGGALPRRRYRRAALLSRHCGLTQAVGGGFRAGITAGDGFGET